MGLSFNKGNYDQFMNMVNTSKELLNDSIILRSIKENIDSRIATLNEDQQHKTDILLILGLALPLFGILLYVNITHGISWRIIPGIALLGFFIMYKVVTKDSILDNQLLNQDLHNEDPRPLKYLGMKVDYLNFISNNKKTSLELLRSFYILFFPFVCYFIYEILFSSPPFGSLLFGLIGSYIIGGTFWYFFFRNDFNQIHFFQKQLRDYKHLINQHNKSLIYEEE